MSHVRSHVETVKHEHQRRLAETRRLAEQAAKDQQAAAPEQAQ